MEKRARKGPKATKAEPSAKAGVVMVVYVIKGIRAITKGESGRPKTSFSLCGERWGCHDRGAAKDSSKIRMNVTLAPASLQKE